MEVGKFEWHLERNVPLCLFDYYFGILRVQKVYSFGKFIEAREVCVCRRKTKRTTFYADLERQDKLFYCANGTCGFVQKNFKLVFLN